jgi:hypothetical protein
MLRAAVLIEIEYAKFLANASRERLPGVSVDYSDFQNSSLAPKGKVQENQVDSFSQ